MQTYQVQFPAGVPFEVIAQALKYVGGEIVDRAAVAPVRKPAAPRKAAAVEYKDLTVYKNGEAVREIDGVTVAKLIAKMDGARRRFHNQDGRTARHYWTAEEFANVEKARPDTVAQEYIRAFCSGLSHRQAEYTNGITA